MRTGRPPAPPSRRDRLSELLHDMKAVIVDIHEANLVHARAQMQRTRSLFTMDDEADRLWREERAAEFSEPEAEVVPIRRAVI